MIDGRQLSRDLLTFYEPAYRANDEPHGNVKWRTTILGKPLTFFHKVDWKERERYWADMPNLTRLFQAITPENIEAATHFARYIFFTYDVVDESTIKLSFYPNEFNLLVKGFQLKDPTQLELKRVTVPPGWTLYKASELRKEHRQPNLICFKIETDEDKFHVTLYYKTEGPQDNAFYGTSKRKTFEKLSEFLRKKLGKKRKIENLEQFE